MTDTSVLETPAPRRSRRRLLMQFVSLGAAAALVALLAYGLIERAPNIAIDEHLAQGQPAPLPSFTLDGFTHGRLGGKVGRRVEAVFADGKVNSRELRGTPLVLNLWASWCDPCRSEAPLLAQATHSAERQGVMMLGIDQQDVTSDGRAFLDHYNIDYPTIRDPGNGVARSFGATGVPETYFVDAKGDVVDHVVGVVTAADLRDGIHAAASGQTLAASKGGAQEALR